MTVLIILGVIIVAIVLYILIDKFNVYTYNKYRYEFFDMTNISTLSVAYIAIFFGYRWYESALIKDGDTLNGILVCSIASIVIMFIIIRNIKATSLLMGIFGSLFLLVVTVPIAAIGLFVFFALMAFASKTTPTYSLNSRD